MRITKERKAEILEGIPFNFIKDGNIPNKILDSIFTMEEKTSFGEFIVGQTGMLHEVHGLCVYYWDLERWLDNNWRFFD